MGGQLSPEKLKALAAHLEGMDKEAIKLPGAGRAAGHVGEYAKGFLHDVRKALTRPFTMGEAWREMGRGVGRKVAPGGAILEEGAGQLGRLERFTKPTSEMLAGGKYTLPSEEVLKVRAGLTPERIQGSGGFFERLIGKGGPMTQEEISAAMRRAITPEELARVGLEPTAEGFAEFGRRLSQAERTGVGQAADVLGIPRWVGREGTHRFKEVGEAVPLTEILRGTAAPDTNRLKTLAEELSRRGWTGKGEVTKYLPVGTKGMIAGFSGASIPGIVDAPKATPTGEGAALERLMREVGSTGGMIAGTGVGFVPGMALWGLSEYGGKRLGRILDRYRAGASLPQAVMAPSPQEAAKQLQTIQQYYG